MTNNLLFSVRTGQAHRTLVGHTAPVTCVQFDELHIVSGSLDKTVRVRNQYSPVSFSKFP
jgi:WD40 repeat protein